MRIHAARNLTPLQRTELEALVSDWKEAVRRLSATNREKAASIADFTRLAVGEGLREARSPKLFALAAEGVRTSMKQFETSHPGLTPTANGLATSLANLGL